MRKPIVIGVESFATKKEATARCRAILYRYQPGQTVHADDSRFLAELLLLHTEAAQKIGCGVASFQVRRNGSTCGFWLVRTDGTATDFSFVHCLTPRTPEREALDGMRFAVSGQIARFRAVTFADGIEIVPCAVTGELIGRDNSHVDHEVPFEILAKDFLSRHGVALRDVAVDPTADGEVITVLADKDLAKAWAEYHAFHARLRMVSARANLSLLRKRAP